MSAAAAADGVQVDIDTVQTVQFDDGFAVEVIDSVADYAALMEQIFDFAALRTLLARPDFHVLIDCMHGGAWRAHVPAVTRRSGRPVCDGDLCASPRRARALGRAQRAVA